MAKQKKIPMRKCLATNQSYPKNEMFRVVRTPEGNVVVDEKGRANGRGAYISKTSEAVEIARKKAIFDHHLEIKVPDSIYQELMELLEKDGR